MALLPETTGATYPTPRQIENGEPQGGGLLGLWNEHAKAMIERTNFLNNRLVGLQNGAGYRDVLSLSASQTLTAADMGECLVFTGTAAATLTLPAFSAVPNGAIEFINTGTANLTVACPGSDLIDTGPSTAASIVIPPNQSQKLVRATGSTRWHCVNLSAAGLAASFGATLAPTGIQRLPSGLILQWMTGNCDASGVLSLLNVVSFSSAVLGGIANEANPSGWGANTVTVWGFEFSASSLSTSVARVRNITAGGVAVSPNILGRIFVWGY